MPVTTDPDNLARVFKAYDIRGTVPDQVDGDLARSVGWALVEVLAARGEMPGHGHGRIVVGHDMRPSSPSLAAALAEGACLAGADVTSIGLASTDQLYFASGRCGVPGAMVTASHNPAGHNGIKLCRALAAPIGAETGLAEIRSRVASGEAPVGQRQGAVEQRDVLTDYADHLRRLAPVHGRRLRVVVDAGNGMAGHTAPAVLGALDVDLVPLYFELDGTFPHHEANPLDPATLRDLQWAVVEAGGDLGLAFDGDADRCFVVDERGRLVSPSVLTALIAARELDREPGARVIHNLITSRVVPQLVAERGGIPVRTRVGHSYIKAAMAETGAIFGGEHSGHFYFRDFWRADSGMLAALHTLSALAEQPRPLSELLSAYSRLFASGELNVPLEGRGAVSAVLAMLEKEYAEGHGVRIDHLDGLTVSAEDWWFNVRPSNTEPLLRLNVEADDEVTMGRVRDSVLATITRTRGER